MARIPQEELDRLKRDISVEQLATAYGIDLKPHGHNLIGLCPMHADHDPSFVVTPAKNLWHCLGACQAGGSVIDLVMRMDGLSFRHAVERLRVRCAQRGDGSRETGETEGLPTAVTADAADHELLRQVVDYYHATLKQSPEALAYLEERGLCSSEMIERFQLGFANRTLTYRLPSGGRTKLRERLQEIGILRASGHEHFNGCLVIPIFDEHGTVTEIYGRKITEKLRAGSLYHLYLPGPHKGVWNIEALKASKEVILCEALIDALTFWCAGYRNVTASYGVEGFTEDHLAAFKNYGTERVLIAYDRDDAGEKAAEKLAAKLSPLGIACHRVHFPRGMDANEYALRVTPASRSLAVLLRSAQWLGGVPANEPAPSAPAAKASPEPSRRDELLDDSISEPPEIASPAVEAEPASPLAAAPASPAPPPPRLEIPTEVKPEEVVIRLGDRKYRVRGLTKNLSYEQLRVNVLCARGDAFHVDTLDLYSARPRALYIKQAAGELGVNEDVIKKDLGKVLLRLEELQDAAIRKTLEPKEKTVTLSEAEQAAAMDLLKDPHLLNRILADFEKCGVVGEETNKLVGYLAAVSRKLDGPLAVTIQSSSAAGKTALMDAVLAFMPEEERVKYSAMTGQALFYMGETDLRHKILAVVEEAGAERATYALKLLQSEGELSIASTGKDPATGKLVTHEYHVEGPVASFFSTTAVDLNEELQNRCLVLAVDESREQTRAIHRLQREGQTLAGMWARRRRAEVQKLHQNAQRLLRPLDVENPYVTRLSFPDTSTRTRRDHLKYLTLIQTIALLHQHQRPLRTATEGGESRPYIEVTCEDIRLANKLAREVLGRSLDELAPQTRRLLGVLTEMVTEACARLAMERSDYRFSRRDVRAYSGWSDFQVKTHMRKLEELEYVLVHRGGRGQSFVYELLYGGEGLDGRPFLMGLIDPDALGHGYDGKKEHPFADLEHGNDEKEPSRSTQGAPKEPPGSSEQRDSEPLNRKHFPDSASPIAENTLLGAAPAPVSYVLERRSDAGSGLVLRGSGNGASGGIHQPDQTTAR